MLSKSKRKKCVLMQLWFPTTAQCDGFTLVHLQYIKTYIQFGKDLERVAWNKTHLNPQYVYICMHIQLCYCCFPLSIFFLFLASYLSCSLDSPQFHHQKKKCTSLPWIIQNYCFWCVLDACCETSIIQLCLSKSVSICCVLVLKDQVCCCDLQQSKCVHLINKKTLPLLDPKEVYDEKHTQLCNCQCTTVNVCRICFHSNEKSLKCFCSCLQWKLNSTTNRLTSPGLMDGKALEEGTAISEDVGWRHILMARVFFHEMKLAELISSEVSAD